MVLHFCILYHRSETKAIFFSVSLQFYPSQDEQKDPSLRDRPFGTPERTRTFNPQNRNLMRYPLRYWRLYNF